MTLPARERLQRARQRLASGDRAGAREALSGLDDEDDVALEANALLAELDEAEGLLTAAADRWERVLADDVDHPQARIRLTALRPEEASAPAGPGEGAPATFVAPEGARALRYRLLRELGRGATAAVYLARDDSLDVDVALKVLHPHLASQARSGARRRFFAEARTAAALRHPGVVAVYDLDEATRTLVMEYLPGGTLRARLNAARTTAAEAAATARGLLSALAFVHERGIVHGDLKPSNLLLRRAGAIVLADFGIAHLAAGPADAARAEDAPAGTPLYLAPEQFRGAPSSIFTDLYAAGAVLWEVMVGRSLRQQADFAPVPKLTPPPLPGAPAAEAEALVELVMALLDPDPGRRLPSAALALKYL